MLRVQTLHFSMKLLIY